MAQLYRRTSRRQAQGNEVVHLSLLLRATSLRLHRAELGVLDRRGPQATSERCPQHQILVCAFTNG